MKKIKSLFKILGIVITLFIIALILIPLLFEDEILKIIKQEINDNVEAKVDFDNASLSLIKSFPNAQISLENLSITGTNEFIGTELLRAKNIALSFDLLSVLRSTEKLELLSLNIDKAKVDVRVLKNGKANYDISKSKDTSSETSSDISFKLENYSINESELYYNDLSSKLNIELIDLNHKGSGEFTQSVFDLKTKTDIRDVNLSSGSMSYLKNAIIAGDAVISMDMTKQKYSFDKNQFNINELLINLDGDVALEKDDILIQLKANSPTNDFKGFLSVIPNAYVKNFNNVEASGSADINLTVNGRLNIAKELYPSFRFSSDIDDAGFKFPDADHAISNLNASVHISNSSAKLSNLAVQIPKFNFSLDDEAVEGKLIVTEVAKDPKINGALRGKINLEKLNHSLPAEGLNIRNGYLDSDFEIDARMSDIENENYNSILFDGDLTVSDLDMDYEEIKPIRVSEIKIKASPESIDIKTEKINIDQNDLLLNGQINNPLAYFLPQKAMNGQINFKSNRFNLNQFLLDNQGESKSQKIEEQSNDDSIEQIISTSNFRLNGEIDQLEYEDYIFNDNALTADLSSNRIVIDQFSTIINDSDLSIKGNIDNAYAYLNNEENLTGQLSINSNKLDLNQFLDETSTENTNASYENFIVPKNIDIDMDANIGQLTFIDLNFTNFISNGHIRDEVIEFENIQTKGLGGTMIFQGIYNSQDESNPKFEFKYDLNKLEFSQAFNQLTSVQKLAPIAKYISGLFNATLVMSGSLSENAEIKYSDLNASGFIETLEGALKGFEPIQKVANQFSVEKLKNWTIENTKNWFEIENGKVNLKEFQTQQLGVDMIISGSHSIDQSMDYNILADIPRELLKSNQIGSLAETGLSLLENEAAKIGLNIDQGDYITVKIGLTGSISDPKIKLTPINSGGKSAQNVIKDQVKDQLDKEKEKIVGKVESKSNEIKDSIVTVAEEQVDLVKSKTEEKVNEVVDSTREMIKDAIGAKVDTIIGPAATDSLGKIVKEKASDIIGNGAEKEIDKLKDKIKDFNPFGKKKKKGN